MEKEKRIFLISEPGREPHNPKGVYFTKFLSDADEIWIPKGSRRARESGFVLAAKCMRKPVREYHLEDGFPVIRPRQERIQDKGYEL